MEQIWKKRIANIILALVTIVFFVSFPWRENWWIGLLCHMAGAAMVGGLADWYAVTALFRKPLGISFKTALIPRSRERITETARHMVEKELLTVPHMYRVIKNNPPVEQLRQYMESEGGEKRLRLYCGRALELGIHFLALPGMQKELRQLSLSLAGQMQLAPALGRMLRQILTSDSGKEAYRFGLTIIKDIAAAEESRRLLGVLYERAAGYYGQTSFLRGMAVAFLLKSDRFSADAMSRTLQRQLLTILDDMGCEDSARYKKIWEYFWSWTVRLEEEEAVQAKVEAWKQNWLDTYGQEQAERVLALLFSEDREFPKERIVKNMMDACRLPKESRLSEQVNRYLLGTAARWLHVIQHKLGDMVEAKVRQYSGDELADAMEAKVHYDLQMIRVNGSLVGAVMGGAVYLVMSVIRGGAPL